MGYLDSDNDSPRNRNTVWEVSSLSWVAMVQPETSLPGSGKTLKTSSFSLNATGTIITAVPNRKLKIYAVKLVVSADMSVNFRSGAGTDLEGVMPFSAKAGFVENVEPPSFLFATGVGQSLDLVISGAGTASGRISYYDDDAT